MRVVGLRESGEVAFDEPLAHGADPAEIAFGHGLAAVRPLDAVHDQQGELALRLVVAPLSEPLKRPPVRRRGRDTNLTLELEVEAEARQRIAAYAVVLSSRGLLATEYSKRTAVDGRWGMPGGGLDPGELPADAVLREVAEETSQRIDLGELVRVQTSHWVGHSPRNTIEDFHAVRLIYTAHCPEPTEPFVADHDGTTRSAAWVGLDAWRQVPWTKNWHTILGELLA